MMGLEHVRNLRLFDDVEVVAASDPHDTSREHALLTKPDLEVFEDHRELLQKSDLDAVIIASPNHTHVDVLADVLAGDLHVLVEKPLCTTVDDCRKVEAAAAGRKGLVWVGMEYRYMAPVARLIQEVRDGAVGALRMLAIREHRLSVPAQGGRLEPLLAQHRRHAGGEVLPLLRSDEPDHADRARCGSTPPEPWT